MTSRKWIQTKQENVGGKISADTLLAVSSAQCWFIYELIYRVATVWKCHSTGFTCVSATLL